MLTFRFTGAKGEMTEGEILVSGMVGKQVRFEFSEEWKNLRKTAVYRAGGITCIQEDIDQVGTIPERILSQSLGRLYVGVYGQREDGSLAIPTVLVPGPFIHIGATGEETPEEEVPSSEWEEMKQALAETLRFTPQTLTEEQKAQVRANIGAANGGLSEQAAALLLMLLRKGVYTEDVTGLLAQLEQALAQEDREPEDQVFYSVSCALEHVTAEPSGAVVRQGESCAVTLKPEAGYVLKTVKVTMGGVDITGSAYAGDKVTIGSVTGNVVITAAAEAQQTETPGIRFVSASIFGGYINNYVIPSNRMSVVTTSVVADTPYPQNGKVYDGDLYLLPIPAGTNVLTVQSPGLIGGPQFFTLSEGVYTCELDVGWMQENGFEYAFEADQYDFVAINFKNAENSQFFTESYDTSGVTVEFTKSQPEKEPEEPAKEAAITLSMTRTSVTNNQRTVAIGEKYTTVFVPADGCFLEIVKVTMGGVDVTADVLKNESISIPKVTGNILILAVSSENPGPVVIEEIGYGSTSFVGQAGLQINRGTSLNGRATVMPVGQYLKEGCRYRFSLGGLTGYHYGVQIMHATVSGLKFDAPYGQESYYNTVDSRLVDTGWMQADYFYTPEGHNEIFTMNFKCDAVNFQESHFAQLMESVIIEEVEQ